MKNNNKNIDKYIESSKPFARPILMYLREVVNSVSPDIKEHLKWSVPNFIYNNNIICNMAAFNEHCSFGFWLSSQMNDPDNILLEKEKRGGLGNLGKIRSIKDLPSKSILKKYIKQSINLVDSGAKLKRKNPEGSVSITDISADLKKALNKNDIAKRNFLKFPPGQKKEYHEWINDAKTEITRAKRLATSIEWISEGKPRNWKYMKKYQNG